MIKSYKYRLYSTKKVFNTLNIYLNGCRKFYNDLLYLEKLSYKVEETGSKLVKINPKNTTKMCSKCFKLVEKSLSDRIHKCSCGLEIDRDFNASLNILRLGLQSLGENP